MSKFPWKTTLAISALLAATVYAFAQMSPDGPMGMHGQMPQGGMMDQMHQQMMQGRGGMGGHSGMDGDQLGATGTPTMPGQDAFGAIQEIVQILQADPKTDWSKVNIETLRQHLIDMNEVTLHAAVTQRDVDNGIEKNEEVKSQAGIGVEEVKGGTSINLEKLKFETGLVI